VKAGGLLHADDVVVYAAPTREGVHAALLQIYELAKKKLACTDAEWTDADGEVHARRYRATFGEDREDLTVKQRAFLHKAVFPQIAEQYTFPDGSRFAWRVWKEFFRERFLGDRYESRRSVRWDKKSGQMVIGKRKTPHKVRISTEDLSIKQYSEYIDTVIDTAVAEYGVVFKFIEKERDDVQWKPKRRKAKGANSEPATRKPPMAAQPVPRPGGVSGHGADADADAAGPARP
jgi:hypothetical protein